MLDKKYQLVWNIRTQIFPQRSKSRENGIVLRTKFGGVQHQLWEIAMECMHHKEAKS